MRGPNRGVGAFRRRERNPNAMFVADERFVFNGGRVTPEEVEAEFRASGRFVRVTNTPIQGGRVVRGFVRNGGES